MVGKQRLDWLAEAPWCSWGTVPLVVLACAAAVLGGAGVVLAEDWPTYRHDMARSGITSEEVAPPLRQCWVFKSRHAPQPAWADPKPVPVEKLLELRRAHFDDVFQPVAAASSLGSAVYFGSSADNKVYCLDAATGAIRWTTITSGPVRLAPAVAGGRVYVGSDDGHAYCLGAEDGSVQWEFRAAPEDRRVLGHGKMISLWPLRTGVLVDEGVAYFGAGIFPAEGVFLFAADAGTGRELWRNDTCGEQPQSRISPQGYLLASKSNLYVPMGRVSPAKFSRSDGRLLQDSPFLGKTVGGSYALLAGEDVYTGTQEMVGYRGETRDQFATFAGRRMVVTDDTAYLASNTHLMAVDRNKANAQEARWKTPCPCPDSLILAGNLLFAGGVNQVVAVDATSGEQVWRAKVDGIAKGLAAADGRLLVSTDKGLVYCFASDGSPEHGVVTQPIAENPYADSPLSTMFAQAAETILAETATERGYCLVLGVETGQLALELAKRSQLIVYAVSPEADKVAAARKALDAAGVYGARVSVDQWPLDGIPYADYFADLIVSETAILMGDLPGEPDEMLRMLKPLGGTAMIGQPAEGPSRKRLTAEALRDWLKQSKLEGGQVIGNQGAWAKITRGALPGAGSWTHQYANPGNTACSDDQRVKAPLGVLWFGRPGPTHMPNRHARAAAPLSIDGRLFVQGENVVMAYDAYNGVKLWQRDMPGAVRTTVTHDSSNLALSGDGLFVAIAEKCLRLDPATGQTKATYHLPPAADGQARRWGYVACVGKLLFGSRTAGAHRSDCVFAVDTETAEHRWVYHGKRIPHNSIAIGDGRVFLVSSDVTDQQRQEKIQERRARLDDLPEPQRAKAEQDLAKTDVRLVVALDAETGQVQWEEAVDLTHCGGFHAGTPTHRAILSTMYHDGVLVLFGVYVDGHYWNQFFAGEFESRRITALSGEDGKFLWSRRVGFRVRPVIVGHTLHTEPWAFDLHTGKPRTRIHPITGEADQWQFARTGHHCGCPCASPNCLFFRSYNLGYYDLRGDYGTMHFGAQRPGCWINFIPAGGLLMMPEASTGCLCAFPTVCTVVFEPVQKTKGWAMYSAPGPTIPVKRLAINLGAPGDRNDAGGKLWLGFPRPYNGRLVLPLKIDTVFHPGGRFVRGNSVYAPFAGTDNPWLFASAASGLQRCVIRLLSEADGAALYRVRMAFADPENGQPGRRVFDIKLQGKLVEENFDIIEAAGGPNHALIKQFDAIEVSDKLVVEMLPKAEHPSEAPAKDVLPNGRAANQLPILQGIEIVRQRVLAPGCSATDFELSSMAPKQAGQIRVANLQQQPLEAVLQITAPDGFQVAVGESDPAEKYQKVSPKQAEIKLAPGERTIVPVEASVAADVPAGKYRFAVRLLGSAGSVLLERTAQIEHLGRRGRIVLKVAEDAYVSHRYPERNTGAANVLLVDGGNKKVGDRDHALAYLKFRLEVPGKPLLARLRIYNAGNPTGGSGRICLVTEPWNEKVVTYQIAPKPGEELARLGRVAERQVVECPLKVDLDGKSELSLVIDPTNCDGVDYVSREGGQPAELIVEFVPDE